MGDRLPDGLGGRDHWVDMLGAHGGKVNVRVAFVFIRTAQPQPPHRVSNSTSSVNEFVDGDLLRHRSGVEGRR
jgi:hypothetical protein